MFGAEVAMLKKLKRFVTATLSLQHTNQSLSLTTVTKMGKWESSSGFNLLVRSRISEERLSLIAS